MSRIALIVDDSKTMRNAIAFTLESDGFSVRQGENGADGLKSLDAGPVDIIITDLNMPIMDGISFVREVRKRQSQRFTPILILTTEAALSKKDEGRQAGATGWIVKPFDPAKLLSVVNRLLH